MIEIKDCRFTGVEFTHFADHLIEALVFNSRTLSNLSEVLKSSNIHIDTLLKVTDGRNTKTETE